MTRRKVPDHEKKQNLLSLRLTDEKLASLDELAERMHAKLGIPVSRTAVALKMMEYGRADLEAEYPPTRRKSK